MVVEIGAVDLDLFRLQVYGDTLDARYLPQLVAYSVDAVLAADIGNGVCDLVHLDLTADYTR